MFAASSTSSDAKFFTNSYKSYQENSKKYNQDGTIGFTKKLNTAIKNHTDLRALSDSCGGCDVVLPEFDEYLQDNLPVIDMYATKESIKKSLQSQGYAEIIL